MLYNYVVGQLVSSCQGQGGNIALKSKKLAHVSLAHHLIYSSRGPEGGVFFVENAVLFKFANSLYFGDFFQLFAGLS